MSADKSEIRLEGMWREIFNRLPAFDEMVERLRERKYKSLKKVRRTVVEENPVCNERHSMDEPKLDFPDFWMPVAYDGREWREFPCRPSWDYEGSVTPLPPSGAPVGSPEGTLAREEAMRSDTPAFLLRQIEDLRNRSESLKRIRAIQEAELQGALAEDSDEVDLAALLQAALSPAPDSIAQEEASAALALLEVALAISNGAAEEGEGGALLAVALAFEAGRRAEKAVIHGDGVATVARNWTSPGREKETLKDLGELEEWKRTVVRVMRQRAEEGKFEEYSVNQWIEALREKGFLKILKSKKLKFGTAKGVEKKTFEKWLRTLRRHYVSEGCWVSKTGTHIDNRPR